MAEHQYVQQPKKTDTITQKQTTPTQTTSKMQLPSSYPMAIIKRAKINPKSLTHADVLQLQRTIGNRAVGGLLSDIGLIPSKAKQSPPVQMHKIPEEDEEPLQGEFESKSEQKACPSCSTSSIQREKDNRTGMPDNLKAGVESLSEIDMSDVRVHYNSDKPAELGALAYTIGTNIHVAPGQEKHLPHEAWHVVQQKQGRIKPTMQIKGKVNVNDEAGLEKEADVMGAKAFQFMDYRPEAENQNKIKNTSSNIARIKRFQNSTNSSLNSQKEIAQRVVIDGTDITKETPLQVIKDTLEWGINWGIQKILTKKQMEELVKELEERDECKEIVEELTEKLQRLDAEVEEGKEVKEEKLEDTDPEAITKKREKSAEEFGWENFPEIFTNLKKIGVHETKPENVKSLVTSGPSKEKIDTGSHIGKGRGFYVTPVGKHKLQTVTREIIYGERFVAVYVPIDLEGIRSSCESENNITALDEKYGNLNCYYIMSGGTEIIIPERCFHLVTVMSRPP